ncbi:MAG: translation initiation factor IF-2 subunit alpha [Desulfurococcales archaeon]|nr:translation initiation factor IF-2 subunit alpha [Desulfurococcales archaeon]
MKSRYPLPRVGELVVGTVEEVYDFGAYLSLDEYGGIRAFLPWSEVASRMVRNIERVVKPGHKIVVKVIRVYRKRRQVDVSLKRVIESEKKRKMMEFKRKVKAATIIKLVGQQLGKTEDEAYREVIWKLEDKYGDAMTGLENAVLYGEQALREAGVPEEWIKPLLEAAKTHVEVKQVKLTWIIQATSKEPDGVDRIKRVLSWIRDKISENLKGEISNLRLYTIGAPRYRLDVTGHDPKTIDRTVSQILEEAEEEASELNVNLSFEKIK